MIHHIKKIDWVFPFSVCLKKKKHNIFKAVKRNLFRIKCLLKQAGTETKRSAGFRKLDLTFIHRMRH